MANDRDGLARMGAGDLLKGGRHAGDDLMPRLAVCRALSEVLLDHPGAKHVGWTPRLDQFRHGRDVETRRGSEECRGLACPPCGAGVDPGDRLGRELLSGLHGLVAAPRGQWCGRNGCRAVVVTLSESAWRRHQMRMLTRLVPLARPAKRMWEGGRLAWILPLFVPHTAGQTSYSRNMIAAIVTIAG